jgi:hypothetical protein
MRVCPSLPQRALAARPLTEEDKEAIAYSYLNPAFKFDEEEHSVLLEEAARIDGMLKNNEVRRAGRRQTDRTSTAGCELGVLLEQHAAHARGGTGCWDTDRSMTAGGWSARSPRFWKGSMLRRHTTERPMRYSMIHMASMTGHLVPLW